LTAGWLAVNQPSPLSFCYLIIPIGLISIAYFIFKAKHLGIDLLASIGFLAISLLAPFTAIASSLSIQLARVIELSVVTSLFFIGVSLNVRIRIRKRSAVRIAFLFHTVSLVVVIFACGLWSISLDIMCNFWARLLRTIWITTNTDSYLAKPLKRIGIEEGILCLGFLITYRTQP